LIEYKDSANFDNQFSKLVPDASIKKAFSPYDIRFPINEVSKDNIIKKCQ
jgi:hypothetical protein